MKVECQRTDINSALIYCFGFSTTINQLVLYRQYSRPATVAIDVGANIGEHTLAMADAVGTSGQVAAFEPVNSIYRRLLDNIEHNSAGCVTAYNMAVGNVNGKIGFQVVEGANIGLSGINPDSDYKVPVATLDSIIRDKQNVSIIKIDVEGHELDVLKGASEILAQSAPAVFMEFNPQQYSMQDLSGLFPYDIEILKIPPNCCSPVSPLEGSIQSQTDVIILKKA